MMTLKEINEKVNKASWETPTCELEQLKADILKKCMIKEYLTVIIAIYH